MSEGLKEAYRRYVQIAIKILEREGGNEKAGMDGKSEDLQEQRSA